jgi:hypothetical protein
VVTTNLKIIDELFAALAGAYHVRFTAAYPTAESRLAAKIVWQKNLSDLTEEQIRYGMSQLATIKTYSEMLPTVSEFRNACFNVKAPQPQFVGLSAPRKLGNPEIAKKHWQQLADKPGLKGNLKSAICKILERYE